MRRAVVAAVLFCACVLALLVGGLHRSHASSRSTATTTGVGAGSAPPAGESGTTAADDGGTESTTQTSHIAPDPDDVDGHDGPPPVSTVGAKSAGATAAAALTRYARLFVNWKASDLNQRARQLSTMSVGQARTAAKAFDDHQPALERYKVTNTGSVAAIARGRGTETGKWAVVVDEDTSGYGPYLGLPATSELIWATVRRAAGGYVIGSWYPVN